MDACLLHYWPCSYSMFYKFRFITRLRVTATSFVISAHVDDREDVQIHTKHPVEERLLHYQLSKPS